MQMISKNRDGVTLIVLIITIIVLTIILSITLNYGLSELHDVSNKKTEAELSIVQEAVMQRYALVKASNQLGRTATAINGNVTATNDTGNATTQPRPEGFVGTRIADPSSLATEFNVVLDSQYTKNQSNLTYEQYYYLLDEADMLELGIEKGDDSRISNEVVPKDRSYVVNYLTGEIFDMANKKYYKTDISDANPVYTQPTKITMENKTYDFNDD